MKYDLNLIDTLISTGGALETEEVTIIIDQIKQTAFSLRSEQEIKLYIQNHQLALIELKKCDLINGNCDTVLYFIETQFQNFVDDTLGISDLGKSIFFNKYTNIIQEHLSKLKSCLNQKVLKCIEPLIDFEKYSHCTIQYVKYVSQFWSSWITDFNFVLEPLEEESIINFLISQNFNSPTFFKYIVGGVIGELHLEDDPYLQEQVLLSYIKRFSIIPVKMTAAFRPDYPNIKPTLDEWLSIEIKQCRKKQKKYNPEQQSIHQKGVHKIETSMSVAQTAYLFKLFNKSGIVTNKAQMDILHVLSEKFSSKKAENISLDSLHNKYYNVEDRTKESVRELLERIIKCIE